MKEIKVLICGVFVFLATMLSYVVPEDIVISRDIIPIIFILSSTLIILFGLLYKDKQN